jgi:hypothetical protein
MFQPQSEIQQRPFFSWIKSRQSNRPEFPAFKGLVLGSIIDLLFIGGAGHARYGVTWDDSSQGPDLYRGFIKAAIAEAIEPNAAWYC